MLQGLASFPGVNRLLECSMHFVHGISPSVAVLTIAPQANFTATIGPLIFTFGTTVIIFPDCRIDASTFERNARGEIWRLSLYDRRWMWACGAISGSYNLYGDDGALIAATERTPQQLAAQCLDAMSEAGYDVSALPNASRPTVEWDYDVPAEALANICDDLGCRVVLGLDNRVRLCRVGIGGALPVSDVLENSLSIDPPELPGALVAVGGRNLYQVDFELEAVGLDTDGQIKPIDELSYTPPAGWVDGDLPYFIRAESVPGTNGSIKNVFVVELAKRSVFRWYRIKVPCEVPGYGTVEELEQLLPILDFQIEPAPGEPAKGDSLPPATVHGVWFPSMDQLFNSTDKLRPTLDDTQDGQQGVTASALYGRAFTLDSQRGMVMFADPVFRNTETANPPSKLTRGPATLRLRACVSVRDPETLAWTRYLRTRVYGLGSSNNPRYIRCDRAVLTHVTDYDPDTYAAGEIRTNQVDVDTEFDAYLDAVEQEYRSRFPEIIKYAGLKPIALDGAIHQVSLSVGPEGATTTAVRSGELPHLTLGYGHRRQLERTRRLQALLKAQTLSARRRDRYIV